MKFDDKIDYALVVVASGIMNNNRVNFEKKAVFFLPFGSDATTF
jgi:hypothetical protein